jgi:hypothetical protein
MNELVSVAILIFPISLFVFFIIYILSGYAHYEITDGNLRIKGIYRKTITINSILNEGIKIRDLKKLAEYRPYIRTNGIGFPGYYEGWFRLKNGEKCILLIRSKDKKIVYIPTKNNFSVILSSKNPERIIEIIEREKKI